MSMSLISHEICLLPLKSSDTSLIQHPEHHPISLYLLLAYVYLTYIKISFLHAATVSSLLSHVVRHKNGTGGGNNQRGGT